VAIGKTIRALTLVFVGSLFFGPTEV
jgi:hypothetical protein